MMRNIIFLIILPFLIYSCNPKSNTEEKEQSKKWVSLFNGENLDGWNMKIAGYRLGDNHGNTFRVEDGVLSIRYDQYPQFDDKFGALYYDKKFSNYRLKAEYRFVGETTPGAPSWGFRDSGVQYHSQDPKTVKLDQQFPVCLEYNLHGGNGIDDRPVGEICTSGTIVDVNGKTITESNCTPATKKLTFHGDQWVTLEIDIRDNIIRHFVNGEEILQYENPRYDPNHEIAKTLISENDDAVEEGFISLQSNSHPIDFRKIEILEY